MSTKYFDGKTHTDPIIEDPIRGNDPLLNEILDIVRVATPPKSPGPELAVEFETPKQMLPAFLISWARYVNPF